MKTERGYKCFEQDPDGNLYALFIDKKTIMPVGEWLQAKIVPTKGFAERPGYHLGEIPDCPWIKSYDGTDIGYYKGRNKGWTRVFAEVEYVTENDYTEHVKGLPGKCFKNKLPLNGFYFFREAGVNRIWRIADKMKIVRVLTEQERQDILKAMNYDEKLAFAPYKSTFEKRFKTIGA